MIVKWLCFLSSETYFLERIGGYFAITPPLKTP